jgi:predicted helicase
VTLFVKRDEPNEDSAAIQWHDIGDYLSAEEKLSLTSDFKSVAGITQQDHWLPITPNKHHDWLNQRDDSFAEIVRNGDNRDDSELRLFRLYSSGVKTNRDAWCYNFSESEETANVSRLIECYASELARFTESSLGFDEFFDSAETDPKKLPWSRGLQNAFKRGRELSLDTGRLSKASYRPFTKTWMYNDRTLNDFRSQMASVFPTPTSPNRVIAITGRGEAHGFSALITDVCPEYKFVYNSQCFPLVTYDQSNDENLFSSEDKERSLSAISDAGLAHFTAQYSESITKEDLFYYIYGLLHSPEYRERYKDNLSKELPRIPAVKKFSDFQAFSQAGRELAHWHLDYETVALHPVTLEVNGEVVRVPATGQSEVVAEPSAQTAQQELRPPGLRDVSSKLKNLTDEHFYVRKMKFPKVKDSDTGKRVNDRTTVIYNEYITVRDIPLEAYDYVVNGKSAIEWVMERQAVTTDKKSGIVNDANLWATETMHNAAYPLELLLRVITVSLETNRIVDSLPKLEID